MGRNRFAVWVVALLVGHCLALPASAQNYGAELYNNAQPASGGLAGVSLSRPQDAQSALFGNPATMGQYRGTTFGFGGAWIEPSISVKHDGFVTRVVGGGPWSGRSEAEGSLVGGFAVVQDLEPFLGMPVTMGVGLNPGSGAAASFREQPGSVGTTADLLALDLTNGFSVRLSDKLSVGGAFILSTGIADLALVQTSGATNDYAAGGAFGISYELPRESSLGVYYRTPIQYSFDALFSIDPPGRTRPRVFRTINMDRPGTYGLGVANQSLMGGDLLLAVDVMYIDWENADLFSSMYKNQWTIALGTQYSLDCWRLRAGYAYNTNPIRNNVGIDVSGFTIGTAAVQYFQATQGPAISQHRLTGGVGKKDLLPNVDLDLFAGGQFHAEQNFGVHTSASYIAWFAGFGLTWHFGAHETGCVQTAPAR